MTSKLKFILSICLSAGLGLCWYPLVVLGDMRIDGSQLLFFAFSAASLVTVAFMAYQVEQWRNRTLELLIFALTGAVSTVLLHYSLLHGNPIITTALFCIAMVLALFLDRLSRGANLAASEFLIILSLLLVAFITLFISGDGLVFHWNQLTTILAGVGFYRLSRLNSYVKTGIPVMTRVSALFIASTWLVGMVLIFSPRSTSFPQENTAFYSALYGVIFLVPVITAVVLILSRYELRTLLLWITMLLSVNLLGVAFYSDIVLSGKLVWLSILILLAYGIQLAKWKALPP